ncbi:perlucin-like [Mya arenaria]|uniref:perlucin-like n=1 Tax=Mya arenaria TaxID=6604 RepID=UPI0022E030AF|nr:perlucin-like [Mya arenaria]
MRGITMSMLLLIHLFAVAAATDCGDDYLVFHGSCYHFGHRPSDFTEAQHYCQQKGGRLVHIETSLENDFIRNHVMEMNSHDWWIGLTDELAEGHYLWSENGKEATFTDWAYNQPQGGSEDCVALEKTIDFHWGDFPCARSSIYPICEASPGEIELIG